MDNALVIAKKELRTKILAQRDALPLAQRIQKSEEIARLLEDYLHTAFDSDTAPSPSQENKPWEGKTIAVYEAMRSEVSLAPFIHRAYQYGAHLCFPCMTKSPHTKNASADSSSEDSNGLPQKKFRSSMVFRSVSCLSYKNKEVPFIQKPLHYFTLEDTQLTTFPLVSPQKIDMVVVPLVAFDKNFNRMGYGGGNYDRLLVEVQPDTIIAGVGFNEQCAPQIPCETHDCALPYIVFA